MKKNGKLSAETPMTFKITSTGDDAEFILTSKADGSIRTASDKTSLQMEEMVINNNITKEYSDFTVEFFVAQHILNAKATRIFTDFVIEKEISSKYRIPDPVQDEKARKALETTIVTRSSFDGISAFSLINMWGHFLMLPNFQLALERGKFSSEEVNSALGVYTQASEAFQNQDVLIRNSQGRYERTRDQDKFLNAWKKVAEDFLKKQTPGTGLYIVSTLEGE